MKPQHVATCGMTKWVVGRGEGVGVLCRGVSMSLPASPDGWMTPADVEEDQDLCLDVLGIRCQNSVLCIYVSCNNLDNYMSGLT